MSSPPRTCRHQPVRQLHDLIAELREQLELTAPIVLRKGVERAIGLLRRSSGEMSKLQKVGA